MYFTTTTMQKGTLGTYLGSTIPAKEHADEIRKTMHANAVEKKSYDID